MKIVIESPDMKLSASLKSFIETKVSKLERLFSFIQAAEVTIYTESKKKGESIICTLNLRIPGRDEYAKSSSPIFEDAILKVLAIAERRLRIRKTQILRNRTKVKKEKTK